LTDFTQVKDKIIKLIETKEIYKVPEERREYLAKRIEEKIIDYISNVLVRSSYFESYDDVRVSVHAEDLVPGYDVILSILKECDNIEEVVFVFYEFARILTLIMVIFSPVSVFIEELSDYWYEIKDKVEEKVNKKISELARMYGDFSKGAS